MYQLITALAAVFVFMMVIMFHEFGHFITAKMVGIKVHEFAIGMGPRIFHKTKGETEYSIRALPIGGYVKMEGEDESSDDPNSFNKKPIGSRILVVVAGAIMNFILAIIVFGIISYVMGMPTTVIDEVIVDTPAYKAGLEPGDKIINVNNKEINSWNNVIKEINNVEPKKDIEIIVLRGSEKKSFTLKPKFDKETGRYLIGITTKTNKSFTSAVKGGVEKTGEILGAMFEFFRMLVTGEIKKGSLSGPVGVIYTVGQAAKYGFMNILYITGLISVNLGFFNLLPIPALDGGRILFMLIELFRGEPLDPEKEGFIHFVGFVLLIILMIYVTYSDIVKFFG